MRNGPREPRLGIWYNIGQMKGECAWRQNADIVVRRAMGTAAPMVRDGFMSIATTRSTASGVARPATGADAPMAQIGCIGMVRAATSAFGAVRHPTARAVRTPRHTAMKSDDNDLLAERRAEVTGALRAALGGLESGSGLSSFVEGHGIQACISRFLGARTG